MIRANLDGAFYCIKAVLPQMLDRKDGVIVNVVSIAGMRANPLAGAAYVAASTAWAPWPCWPTRSGRTASA